MNTPEVVGLFKVLAGNYAQWGDRFASRETVVVWTALLSQEDARAVIQAAIFWCREEKFPPTVADLIELVRGADASSGDAAWTEVERLYATLPWHAPESCGHQPPPEPEWTSPRQYGSQTGAKASALAKTGDCGRGPGRTGFSGCADMGWRWWPLAAG